MNTYLKATVEALLDSDEVAASSHLKEYFEQKKAAILREDHEKFMTSDEMEQHILKLHNKAPDKKEFLNNISNSDEFKEKFCTIDGQTLLNDILDKLTDDDKKKNLSDFMTKTNDKSNCPKE